MSETQTPIYRIFDVQGERGIPLKAAEGQFRDHGFSIRPQLGYSNKFDIGFLTNNELLGEPVQIDGENSSIEEVADWIARGLQNGLSAGRIKELLESNEEAISDTDARAYLQQLVKTGK